MKDATLETQETESIEEIEVEETEFVADNSNADKTTSTSFADEETGETGEETGETGETGEEEEANSDDETGEKKPRQNHSLEEIENQFAALQKELENTKAELESLREFKLEVENQQKDELIAKYHMLSDSAREEISSQKSNYTIEELEAKLALAFVKENVDFNEVDGKRTESEAIQEDPITTFSLNAAVDTTIVSPVLQALRDVKNNN